MICAACNHPEIDHHGLECLRPGCDCRGFEAPDTDPASDPALDWERAERADRDDYGGTW